MRKEVGESSVRKIQVDALGKYVDLLSDVGFKIVFGKEANKEIIIEFLNHIIQEHRIYDFEYIDKEKVGGNSDSKKNIYDLYCKTDSGIRIVVEVQRESQEYFVDRSIYYMTHPVQEQIERGTDVYSFCPVYMISILDFKLPQLSGIESVRSHFRLKECNSGIELTNKYNLIYIELPKFNKQLEEIKGNVLEGFYYCLKHMQELKSRPISFEQKVFELLFKAANVAQMSKDEYHKYISNMTTERDRRNQMAYAVKQGIQQGKQEGLKEGLEKGRAEALSEIIKMNMSTMNFHDIAKFLGMNVEDVKRIATQN